MTNCLTCDDATSCKMCYFPNYFNKDKKQCLAIPYSEENQGSIDWLNMLFAIFGGVLIGFLVFFLYQKNLAKKGYSKGALNLATDDNLTVNGETD